MKKENEVKIDEITHVSSGITGFDTVINDEDRSRIDSLVDDYEKAILKRLEAEYNKNTTKSDKIADNIAKFGGSWKFIVIMASTLAFWLIWNSLPFVPHFDKSPYILLNLLLSFTAAFQAPIIMMSQNRKANQDKNESVIDFAINYKSEKEIYDMQGHLHRIEKELYEIRNLLNKKDM